MFQIRLIIAKYSRNQCGARINLSCYATPSQSSFYSFELSPDIICSHFYKLSHSFILMRHCLIAHS